MGAAPFEDIMNVDPHPRQIAEAPRHECAPVSLPQRTSRSAGSVRAIRTRRNLSVKRSTVQQAIPLFAVLLSAAVYLVGCEGPVSRQPVDEDPVTEEPSTDDPPGDPVSVRLDFVRGNSWPYPQIFVIWAENVADGFMQTLYVCQKLVTGGGLTNTALPYWNMDRRQYADPAEIDAVSGPSLQGDFSVEAALKVDQRQFTVYFEFDHSFDPNHWFGDQPAMLFRADADLDSPESEFPLTFVGWTPNQGTENVIPDPPAGVPQSETRYITHHKDEDAPDGFGDPDTRSVADMVDSITLVVLDP